MKIFIPLFVISILLLSCGNENKEITLPASTGAINDVLVVMDDSMWKGNVGDSVRNILAAPVLGLPQEETQFSITQVTPKTFNNLFKANRNILFAGTDKSTGFSVQQKIYASPQVGITIIGKNKNELIAELGKHKDSILRTFKNGDLKMYQKRFTQNSWATSEVETFKNLGFKIDIPQDFAKVTDTGDFLWFRKYITRSNSMNILAYTMPLQVNDTVINTIVANRNTIGEKYIPGQFEGSYMITEAAYTPFIKPTTIAGKKAYETRGKWEVKGDFMAGPFLNYTILDKENNRLIVIEGFTYAPSIKKRDYMFELEAILKTIQFTN
ncbi:MAG: DUF4837 domain-containing protein [Flavobacteriales bacterium]|nr:MAG: DUF4837 domain-containing protein [Flavobacteriales bacterium]